MVFTTDDLMAEIKNGTRESREIKATVESIASSLKEALLEISDLKARCVLLEKENGRLENEVRLLKRQSRNNNFIIYRVPEHEERSSENVLKTVQKTCEAAGIELKDTSVNNCFRLGRSSKDRPILVSLTRKLVKNEVMLKKEDFARLNTPISHDRTPEERDHGRKIFNLMSHLKKIDKNATYQSNKFKFRGVFHTMEEVEEIVQGNSQDLGQQEASNIKKLKQQTLKIETFRHRTQSN